MEREHLGRSDSDERLTLRPSKGKTSVPRDHAKCKNRAGDLSIAVPSVSRSLELHGGKFAMTHDPSRPATAPSSPQRKPLTPPANRPIAAAEAQNNAPESTPQPAH